MAIETKPVTLDGTTFTLTTLSAPIGRKVALRLAKPIGAALKLGSELDIDIGRALDALSDQDIDFISSAFAKEALVEHVDTKAKTSRVLKLELVQDDLFAGPSGHRLWLKFMGASVELNFGDFSDVLGAAFRKLEKKATASESPSTLTGGSAASSPPST